MLKTVWMNSFMGMDCSSQVAGCQNPISKLGSDSCVETLKPSLQIISIISIPVSQALIDEMLITWDSLSTLRLMARRAARALAFVDVKFSQLPGEALQILRQPPPNPSLPRI